MIGIERKRFATAVERILKEELQKGNLPSSKEFGLRLTQYLQSQNLGRPEYEFRRFRNGEVAFARDYNEIVTKVQHDLTILYENTIALHDELRGKFDWFETEKNKVEYEARKLENELKEKINLYGKTGFLASVFDIFDDLSKVSTQENVVVDVKKHEVALKQEENTSFMFQPQGSIVFQMPQSSAGVFKRVPLSGKPDRILSSYENEVWQEIWLAKERGPASGYLEYVFDRAQTLNRIEFDLQTIKPCKVLVEFTPDDLNWFHLPYYEEGLTTSSKVSFDFPTIEVKALRVWMEKSEHDGEIVHPEGYQYQYVFGAKSLKLYQLRYPEVGTFVGTELTPVVNGPFSIGKVSLVVEEELPTGTDIEYFISVPEETQGWKSISPVNRENPQYSQIIDFKYVTNAPAQKLGIPAGINTEEHGVTELTANGISFYQIGSIEKKDIINKTERLYVGKRAWLVKQTTRSFTGSHIPTLDDWFNPPNEVTTTFQNMETGKPSVLMQGRKHTVNSQYYYGLGLFCEEKEKVFTTTPASTEPIAIFLNGEKIYEGLPNSRTQVNYVLKNGWNDIVVLVYVQSVNTANGSTIDIGFDPNNLSSAVYASSKPMEKVSLFDLQYNIKNNDWNKYAFYEHEGKTYIILNYGISGISYDLFFDYVDQNAKDKIQLKAVFRQFGKGAYTTPKLKRYTLQFS